MLSHRKSKMISFRMSDREYEEFMGVCLLHGAHSASEGARLAIETLVRRSQVPEKTALVEQVQRLDQEVGRLDRRMQDICQLLANLPGGRGKPPESDSRIQGS